jgi:hypothetical protein
MPLIKYLTSYLLSAASSDLLPLYDPFSPAAPKDKEIIMSALITFALQDFPRLTEINQYAYDHEMTTHEAIVELVDSGLSNYPHDLLAAKLRHPSSRLP